MSEKDKAKEKRGLIWEAIKGLSDNELLNNDNFTYWGSKFGIITYCRNEEITEGNGNPPTPPPPPPPPPEG